MILLILKQKDETIELLVMDDFDISLITENIDRLFKLAELYNVAMKNFMRDYSSEFEAYEDFVTKLKDEKVIGFPVTPAVDARLYALDKKIQIDSELEIQHG